jgi:hypothetical protein
MEDDLKMTVSTWKMTVSIWNDGIDMGDDGIDMGDDGIDMRDDSIDMGYLVTLAWIKATVRRWRMTTDISSAAFVAAFSSSQGPPADYLYRSEREIQRETLPRVRGGTRLSPWPPCDDPRPSARGLGRVRAWRRMRRVCTFTRVRYNLV